jgi:hypothetical protein
MQAPPFPARPRVLKETEIFQMHKDPDGFDDKTRYRKYLGTFTPKKFSPTNSHEFVNVSTVNMTRQPFEVPSLPIQESVTETESNVQLRRASSSVTEPESGNIVEAQSQ